MVPYGWKWSHEVRTFIPHKTAHPFVAGPAENSQSKSSEAEKSRPVLRASTVMAIYIGWWSTLWSHYNYIVTFMVVLDAWCTCLWAHWRHWLSCPHCCIAIADSWSKDFNDFIANCLTKEAIERPSAAQLLQVHDGGHAKPIQLH